jgi:hypothetical protein
MRLNIVFLVGFLSFNVFAQSHSNGITIPPEKKPENVGFAVDGEAMGERCLSPETTFADAGSILSFEFTEPKPLIPAGAIHVFIQNGKVVSQDKRDRKKPYCSLDISEKHKSTSMQLIEEPIKVKAHNPMFDETYLGNGELTG